MVSAQHLRHPELVNDERRDHGSDWLLWSSSDAGSQNSAAVIRSYGIVFASRLFIHPVRGGQKKDICLEAPDTSYWLISRLALTATHSTQRGAPSQDGGGAVARSRIGETSADV